MPVITCSLSKEGKLMPIAVEFEPGDIIHFKADEPVHVEGHGSAGIEVRLAFGLNEIVASPKAGGLVFSIARPGLGGKNPPPPPPGVTPITIRVEPQSKGAQQAAGKSQ